MDAETYAGVSEEEFARFFNSYRELCANTWYIYAFLFIDTCAKGILWSPWLDFLPPRAAAFIALLMAGLPLTTYFAITFCQFPPPVHPQTFRRLLLFVVTWTTLGTLVLIAIVLPTALKSGHLVARATLPLLVSVAAVFCVVPMLSKRAAGFGERCPDASE